MKRRYILGLIFLVCILFWFFNNLFGIFTGQSISEFILSKDRDVPSEGGEKKCVDSDDGKNYFVRGTVEGYDIHGDFYVVEDSCDEINLTEYFCRDFSIMYVIYPCEEGCLNGACIDSSVVEDLSCVDSDGGKNYFVKGSCEDSFDFLEDVCVIGGSKGWFLKEVYCEEGRCVYFNYDCLEGCDKGKCVGEIFSEEDVLLSPDEEEYDVSNCIDSDGDNLNIKGVVEGSVDGEEVVFEDQCILNLGKEENLKVNNCQGEECLLRERLCVAGMYVARDSFCSQGCVDGACIPERSFFSGILEFFKGLF